jgi:hypothetical protein
MNEVPLQLIERVMAPCLNIVAKGKLGIAHAPQDAAIVRGRESKLVHFSNL